LNLIFGFLVFFPGLAIGIKSTRELYRKGHGLPWGELNEPSKSKKLVINGLYAYCRNPMTLGYSLLPSGMGIMFQSLSMTFLIPTIIIGVAAIYLKLWEEPHLETRFGETYRKYKRKTPFLIPRLYIHNEHEDETTM
jgi:protein-S-isoprenylcysteine O-methyltransferase Ste14